MASTTAFIRNELILGETLSRSSYNRRAKEQLFEIKNRMEQVLYEYDISEEAYSILEKRVGSKDQLRDKEHQQEILEHILDYKEACRERNKALAALEFFFSSYCELEKQQNDPDNEEGGNEAVFSHVYHPDFSSDFDAAYVNANSALHRLKFLNSQIVALASEILNKKRKIEVQLRQRATLGPDEIGQDYMFDSYSNQKLPYSSRSPHKVSLDAAEQEFERVLVELENKVAMNSRLKKYVNNQEEAVDVCQSIARRLAVDNTHMLATFASSLKDVKLACQELERCSSMIRELQEKYEIPANECSVNTEQNKDILSRNNMNFRNLKKYERNVKEIEVDFSRLEQLNKLLDTMKLQLHEASLRKELTEEQLRGRIARLRSEVTDECPPSRASSRTRGLCRDENGDHKKGKKRKSGKKKVKKSTKSSTFSDAFSTTTIGDESVFSEGDSTGAGPGAALSPVSNISESVECTSEQPPLSLNPVKESWNSKDKLFEPCSSAEKILKKKPRIKSAKSRGAAIMNEVRLDTPEKESPPVLTALESQSSPSIVPPDPIGAAKKHVLHTADNLSDTCITRPDKQYCSKLQGHVDNRQFAQTTFVQ